MLAVTAVTLAQSTHTGSASMLTIGSALVAAVLTVVVWPALHFAVTIAHEGGHALSGSLMGGKVNSIHVHRTKGGVTAVKGLGSVGGLVFTLAGYIGPTVFGLAGAIMLVDHLPKLVIWSSVVLLALATLQAGNLHTGALVVGLAVVFIAVGRYGSDGEQAFFAYTWVWFLLMGGFRHVLDLLALRSRVKDTSSDIHALRKMTSVPAAFWSGLFWLLSAVGLIYGGGILLGFVQLNA